MPSSLYGCQQHTFALVLEDRSVQIYHPIFSEDNFDGIVALEIAMQTVFDHEMSQLPEALSVTSDCQGSVTCTS